MFDDIKSWVVFYGLALLNVVCWARALRALAATIGG